MSYRRTEDYQRRTLNGGDFVGKYKQIRSQYEQEYRVILNDIRTQHAHRSAPIRASRDEALEAQFREFFATPFLRALNWQPRDLIPESRVTSATTGSMLRMDYLGIDGEPEAIKPLMIVETKPPSSQAPRRREASTNQSFEESPSDDIPKIVGDALRQGEQLAGEWNQWLSDLGRYVRSIHARTQTPPKRALIASSHWMILFTDPADSFLAGGTCDPNRIHVFLWYVDSQNRVHDDFVEKGGVLFELLEHQKVLDSSPWLTVAELPFCLKREGVSRTMHGLWLRYITHPGQVGPSPIIEVTPIVFLQSMNGSWLIVEAGRDRSYKVPDRYEELTGHIEDVSQEASDLLSNINKSLGASFAPRQIVNHYRDEDAFDLLKGVTPHGSSRRSSEHYQDFLIATGEQTHYLRPEPSVTNCQYHDYDASKYQQCQALVRIESRSSSNRSFFMDKEDHHCTHRDVEIKKSSGSNRETCGLRSGGQNGAFCEIWAFEKRLCCRTCVFEQVCTSKPAFVLPCADKLNSAN